MHIKLHIIIFEYVTIHEYLDQWYKIGCMSACDVVHGLPRTHLHGGNKIIRMKSLYY